MNSHIQKIVKGTLLSVLSVATASSAFATDCKVNFFANWTSAVPRGPIVSLMDPSHGPSMPRLDPAVENQAIELFEKTNKLSPDDCGAPVLAAGHGFVKLVDKFIKAKVDLYAAETLNEPMTPLLAAAYGGHLPVVKLLSEKGAAKINEATPIRFTLFEGMLGGFTALHFAAMECKTMTVKYLLEHGASPGKRANGRTPLDWAERNGCKETANLLTEYTSKK